MSLPLSFCCNAFRIVLHSFLFNVLAVLCIPIIDRIAILSIYLKIIAYSSGLGDGSFLFNVLCGVKTGCPLSSVLFIFYSLRVTRRPFSGRRHFYSPFQMRLSMRIWGTLPPLSDKLDNRKQNGMPKNFESQASLA